MERKSKTFNLLPCFQANLPNLFSDIPHTVHRGKGEKVVPSSASLSFCVNDGTCAPALLQDYMTLLLSKHSRGLEKARSCSGTSGYVQKCPALTLVRMQGLSREIQAFTRWLWSCSVKDHCLWVGTAPSRQKGLMYFLNCDLGVIFGRVGFMLFLFLFFLSWRLSLVISFLFTFRCVKSF